MVEPTQDYSLWEWAFKAIVGATLGAVGWFINGLSEDVRETSKQAAENKNHMLEAQLRAEEKFASKSDMDRSLERLHGRIDDMGKDIKDVLKIVSSR